MDDIADRTLFVNKILRRYEEDVPPIKQRLWDGEDRLLLAEIESLRSDNARLAKELEEARKALEPFSVYADLYFDGAQDSLAVCDESSDFVATLGDFRRAAAIRHKATVTTDDLPEGGRDA